MINYINLKSISLENGKIQISFSRNWMNFYKFYHFFIFFSKLSESRLKDLQFDTTFGLLRVFWGVIKTEKNHTYPHSSFWSGRTRNNQDNIKVNNKINWILLFYFWFFFLASFRLASKKLWYRYDNFLYYFFTFFFFFLSKCATGSKLFQLQNLKIWWNYIEKLRNKYLLLTF